MKTVKEVVDSCMDVAVEGYMHDPIGSGAQVKLNAYPFTIKTKEDRDFYRACLREMIKRLQELAQ